MKGFHRNHRQDRLDELGFHLNHHQGACLWEVACIRHHLVHWVAYLWAGGVNHPVAYLWEGGVNLPTWVVGSNHMQCWVALRKPEQ